MNKYIGLKIKLGLILCVSLLTCQVGSSTSFASKAGEGTPIPQSTSSKTTQEGKRTFKIVGYIRDRVGEIRPSQFEMVTHIIYASLLPKSDGTIRTIFHPDKLSEVVDIAHTKGVLVLISVGGWGHKEKFEDLTEKYDTRTNFIKEVVDFVDAYDLDGVDIDWEFPVSDPKKESAKNYLLLMQGLDAALGEKLLTADVMAQDDNRQAILPEVFEVVDFVNIMAYGDAADQHALLSYAVEALEYWRGRGIPPEQLVLGLPFYGRPGTPTYKWLVEVNSNAPYLDKIFYYDKYIYYNGIPAIKRKTALAIDQASGVMIWTLDKDTVDDTSLLKAIYETACDASLCSSEAELPSWDEVFSIWQKIWDFSIPK